MTYGGRTILIDPKRDQAEAWPATPITPNLHPNPLAELPPGWCPELVVAIENIHSPGSGDSIEFTR